MVGIDSGIGGAATWAAIAVSAYLALGLLATLAAGRGPGRVAAAVLRLYPRLARAAMRSAVAATVGMGTTVGGAVAAEAGAPHPPTPPVVAPASPPAEPFDWPLDAAATATKTERPPHVSAAGVVVVRPGDCLWRIAARSIGRGATPMATAAVWPRWWSVNRVAIGDNPDLLRPGLRLRAPRTFDRSG
jgi:nucleoid-associated protein YgaU